jgi:hypothetical protein
MKATGLPWTIAGTTTSDVTVNGFHSDVRFEPKPGTVCNPTYPNITFSGKLGGGVWNAAQHQITYDNAPGVSAIVFHSGGPEGGPRDSVGRLP